MERVKTGINGLDELIQGGIPKGSSVLISGANGSGKSILSMQYIYEGAKQLQDPGLFVTVESNVKTIAWNMESFDWDIANLQDKDLMSIYRVRSFGDSSPDKMTARLDAEFGVIEDKVKEIGAKRLVVDSTTALGVSMERGPFRSLLFGFMDRLKKLDCTTLLTAETRNIKTEFSAFGVEEFVVDGVIALYFTPPHRSIFVRKMRGTAHDKNVHPFEITENGILVKSKEQVLWEAIK